MENETLLQDLGYKQELKRVLKLKDAVVYGLAMITPTAPLPMLGIIASLTMGHMATAYLIALFGMSLTALSYGKMASHFPIAGSTYSYTQQCIGSNAGFMAGWAMIIDYLLIPLMSVIFVAVACSERFPAVPYSAWVVLLALLLTLINLMGISLTNKANTVFSILMVLIVVLFVGLGASFVLNGGGAGTLVSFKPFYTSELFKFSTVMAGTSIAVFSYIGFDAVSTIAEEVEEPSKNIPRAIILTCIISGIIFIAVTYLAQLIWPDVASFPEKKETVVFAIAGKIGGRLFDGFVFFIILVAGVSSALVGQASGSRLLYSMGRDNVLPKRFFGYISPKYGTPVFNVLLMGIISLCGGMASSFQQVAEVVNFGAFIGYMCVSLSVVFYYSKNQDKGLSFLGYLVVPLCAIATCFFIFINLSKNALILGSVWLAAGFVLLLIVSRFFTRKIVLREIQ